MTQASIDPHSSQRLALLRFPLIVGVVFIHAYATKVQTAGETVGVGDVHPLVSFLIEALSQEIARSAVPVFFLISGLLFFHGFTPSWAGYVDKWRSRVRTLLIPFLFWNLLTAGLFALAQSLPATRAYFSGASAELLSLSPTEFLAGLFGIGRAPFSYPFWFIRDLMLLVLLAPLLGLLLQRAWLLAPLFVAWAALPGWQLVPSLEALAFFSLGAYLGLNGRSPFALDRWAGLYGLAYAMALPLVVLGPAEWRPWLHQGLVALGVVMALALSAWAMAWREPLLKLAAASFFVYAAHEPLLTIARKLAYRALHPSSSWQVLLLYLAVPLTVVVLLLLLQRVLQRLLPGPLAWVSGGR